jgi:hypothetical protein
MKKILLITYYFPPCGGAGVQRWLKLIKYLLNEGWETTVITTHEGDYPVLDPSLCKKIPLDLKVIRTQTPSLSKLYRLFAGKDKKMPYGTLESSSGDSLFKKISLWARYNLITSDIRAIWNRTASKNVLGEVKNRKYDLMVTTGPPHSTHLVALKLKKKITLPWVADFRDPWANIFYLQQQKINRIPAKITRNLEKRVITKATLNTIVSKSIADSLPEGNKVVLYNGYDPEDYFNTTQVESSFFRIKYVGRITQGQDMCKVLGWINEFCLNFQTDNIEVSLIGTVFSEDINSRKFPNTHLRIIGQISHSRAINEMVNSEALLLLINNCPDNKGILTSKLFEYIGSGSYILGIGPPDGEAAELLSAYSSGKMINYTDKETFFHTLNDLYRLWSANKLTKNDSNTKPLSSPFQAKELAGHLNDIVRDR